tara:strand:+ start:1379 stop:1585 length:207 start_codon:yes stop_codon:yes gene_type:complete
MKIKVKDSGSLFRDEESGAILNCSNSEYDSYLKLKKQKIEETNEMDKLKNDVDELKDMMKLILSKLDK